MHVTLITMHVTAITCTVLILGIHGLNPAYGPTYLYGIKRSSQSQRILQVKPLIFHIFWTPDACVCVCQKVKRVKSFSRVCIGILTEAEAVLKMSMVVKVRKQLNLLVWCRRNSVHSVVSTTLWCARYATANMGQWNAAMGLYHGQGWTVNCEGRITKLHFATTSLLWVSEYNQYIWSELKCSGASEWKGC